MVSQGEVSQTAIYAINCVFKLSGLLAYNYTGIVVNINSQEGVAGSAFVDNCRIISNVDDTGRVSSVVNTNYAIRCAIPDAHLTNIITVNFTSHYLLRGAIIMQQCHSWNVSGSPNSNMITSTSQTFTLLASECTADTLTTFINCNGTGVINLVNNRFYTKETISDGIIFRIGNNNKLYVSGLVIDAQNYTGTLDNATYNLAYYSGLNINGNITPSYTVSFTPNENFSVTFNDVKVIDNLLYINLGLSTTSAVAGETILGTFNGSAYIPNNTNMVGVLKDTTSTEFVNIYYSKSNNNLKVKLPTITSYKALYLCITIPYHATQLSL